jgi:two-component system, NtrC family, response regulator AtoC
MWVKTLVQSGGNDDKAVMQGPSGLLAPSASQAMKAIESVVADLAATDIPVMVEGETGTGKELLALAIHQLSHRSQGPFTKIRCSSLDPDGLSKLAGSDDSPEADLRGGTLFLDEVADLSALCQTKLLEAFSARDDGSEEFQLGACVISTTCQDLESVMRAGGFRRDLYFRLSGVCLRVPPLRKRKEDILPLADFFLDKHAKALGRPRPHIEAETIRRLNEYDWPGNVRELENAMRRAVALGREVMAAQDFLSAPQSATSGGRDRRAYSLKEAARAASRQAERELILKVLSETRWNRKRAAEALRISYKALLYKLKQIGLEEPTP